MTNVSFTRDEVILALDVLYANGNKPLRPEMPEIVELSKLLRDLPIVPEAIRPSIFRNCRGVCNQLNAFRRESLKGQKDPNVGQMFYVISDEYSNSHDRISAVAKAIKRNVDYIPAASYLRNMGFDIFREGAILEYTHRMIEKRQNRIANPVTRCEICFIDLKEVYKDVGEDLQKMHLIVPPEELDYKKQYNESDFIVVCPNCHEMLHGYRPWLSREQCAKILK